MKKKHFLVLPTIDCNFSDAAIRQWLRTSYTEEAEAIRIAGNLSGQYNQPFKVVVLTTAITCAPRAIEIADN